MDFRKDDKVWSPIHGNGFVINVIQANSSQIRCLFEDNHNAFFDKDGREYPTDFNRTLFHGHDLEIIGEKLPRQKKVFYINFYPNAVSEKAFGTFIRYHTEEMAKRHLTTGGQTIPVEMEV